MQFGLNFKERGKLIFVCFCWYIISVGRSHIKYINYLITDVLTGLLMDCSKPVWGGKSASQSSFNPRLISQLQRLNSQVHEKVLVCSAEPFLTGAAPSSNKPKAFIGTSGSLDRRKQRWPQQRRWLNWHQNVCCFSFLLCWLLPSQGRAGWKSEQCPHTETNLLHCFAVSL